MEREIKRTNKEYVYSLYWKERKEERYDEALNILHINADDPTAMWLLGRCYNQGCLVTEDKEVAFSLFEKSASLVNPEAMAAVANVFEWGDGCDGEWEKSF